MPVFGKTSRRKLNTCNANIQVICYGAIKIIDFGIITGYRNKQEQNALYPRYTRLKYPHGKHNKYPSLAVDVAPYIPPYGYIFGHKDQLREIMERNDVSIIAAKDFVIKSYARLIGVIETIAFQKGISIRVGIDWDGDFDMLDQDFHDLGHVELKNE